MKSRFLFILFFSSQMIYAEDASDVPSDLQAIGGNVAQTLGNAFEMLGGLGSFLTKVTKVGTDVLAAGTAFGAKYQKTSCALGATLATYLSWRCYDSLTFSRHVNDARYFLGPILPTTGDATVPDPALVENATLKVRNLNVTTASADLIQNYLDRLEVLKRNLAKYSKLAEWAPEIAALPGLDNFMTMHVALTEAQITQAENFINPRIACLGLPKNYDWRSTPWVWGERISAPFNGFNVRSWNSWRSCCANAASSYIQGAWFTYAGEATRLTWQLFIWEKRLRARHHELGAA